MCSPELCCAVECAAATGLATAVRLRLGSTRLGAFSIAFLSSRIVGIRVSKRAVESSILLFLTFQVALLVSRVAFATRKRLHFTGERVADANRLAVEQSKHGRRAVTPKANDVLGGRPSKWKPRLSSGALQTRDVLI